MKKRRQIAYRGLSPGGLLAFSQLHGLLAQGMSRMDRLRTVLVTVCVLGFFLPGCSPASSEQGVRREAKASSPTAAAADPEKGSEVFRGRCSSCHLVTSTTARLGPGLKGLFQQERLSRIGLPATEQTVRKVILEGSGSMQPFRGVLTDEELEDLIAYLRTI